MFTFFQSFKTHEKLYLFLLVLLGSRIIDEGGGQKEWLNSLEKEPEKQAILFLTHDNKSDFI